jgi:hypothetical protein
MTAAGSGPGARCSSSALGWTRNSGQIVARSSRRRGDAEARMTSLETPERDGGDENAV